MQFLLLTTLTHVLHIIAMHEQCLSVTADDVEISVQTYRVVRLSYRPYADLDFRHDVISVQHTTVCSYTKHVCIMLLALSCIFHMLC